MPLSPPPRDATGAVVAHDHNGIAAQDRMIRRISPHHIVPDAKSASGLRVSTMAFQPSTIGNRSMSVDLERSMLEARLDPRVFVTAPPFIGSVWFRAADLRSLSLQVGCDPTPTNPHHGGVWGQFNKLCQKQLLSMSAWYVALPNVSLGNETLWARR